MATVAPEAPKKYLPQFDIGGPGAGLPPMDRLTAGLAGNANSGNAPLVVDRPDLTPEGRAQWRVANAKMNVAIAGNGLPPAQYEAAWKAQLKTMGYDENGYPL